MKEKIHIYRPKVILDYLLFHFLKTRIMKFFYLTKDINIEELNQKLNNFELNVEELEYNDFLQGDKDVFKDEKLDIIKNRCLDKSYKAYGIKENNQLIYSTWISYDNLGLPIPTKIKLNTDEALLEDSYSHPAFRGKGLHGKMNVYRLKKIYDSGRTKAVVIVLNGNKPALKVQMNTGFEKKGSFYAGSIFGLTFNTLKKEKYDNR